MHYQINVTQGISGSPSSPNPTVTNPAELASLLQQILEVNRDQAGILRSLAGAQDQTNRWRSFLQRWEQPLPADSRRSFRPFHPGDHRQVGEGWGGIGKRILPSGIPGPLRQQDHPTGHPDEHGGPLGRGVKFQRPTPTIRLNWDDQPTGVPGTRISKRSPLFRFQPIRFPSGTSPRHPGPAGHPGDLAPRRFSPLKPRQLSQPGRH
jgi:hypothetical protein